MNRLFEIVYMLLEKKTVTAKELADHFEVSTRTIYRDVDKLAIAGVPIFTNKGSGGGISLMEQFVLRNSMLSEHEQLDILNALHGLHSLMVPDVLPVLNKLGAVFQKESTNWIDVDFSRWGSNTDEKGYFSILKRGVMEKQRVTFTYYGSDGTESRRTVEPLQIQFRGQSWYMFGFCLKKSDYRYFKISRMKSMVLESETFVRELPEQENHERKHTQFPKTSIVMKVDPEMAYRVYDEFKKEQIERLEDGSFLVTIDFPENEWVYGYILSYGKNVEVISPESVRNKVAEELRQHLKKYDTFS